MVTKMPNTPVVRRDLRMYGRAIIAIGCITLLLTGFAIFQRWYDNKQTAEWRDGQDVVNSKFVCVADIFKSQISALNERTEKTVAERAANIAVQHALIQVQTLLLTQGATREQFQDALTEYARASATYQQILEAQNKAQAQFPYPTVEQVEACLS